VSRRLLRRNRRVSRRAIPRRCDCCCH
jgi:hypothetical protein